MYCTSRFCFFCCKCPWLFWRKPQLHRFASPTNICVYACIGAKKTSNSKSSNCVQVAYLPITLLVDLGDWFTLFAPDCPIGSTIFPCQLICWIMRLFHFHSLAAFSPEVARSSTYFHLSALMVFFTLLSAFSVYIQRMFWLSLFWFGCCWLPSSCFPFLDFCLSCQRRSVVHDGVFWNPKPFDMLKLLLL